MTETVYLTVAVDAPQHTALRDPLTYLGNAPNLMIYAIASEQGVRMPGFFAYVLWAVCVLVPLFLLLTLLPISPILKLS